MKVLDKIENEGIKPRSKGYFRIKNILLWSSFIISILLASVMVSVDIYLFATYEALLQKLEGGSFWTYFFVSLPYLWIIFTFMFVILARKFVQETKEAYRLPIIWTTLGGILVVLVLGELFYITGVGEYIEHQAREHLPIYDDVLYEKDLIDVK